MQLHVEITNRILAELEKGTVPWVKPWAVPSPYNAATQHRYSGVNVLLLWDTPYQRPAWLTFRQATTLGGRVKKGEHATPIVYVSTITKTEGDEEKEISYLRRYHVFNVEQVEGLPGNLYAAAQARAPNQVEEFFAAIPADVRHGGTVAYYQPLSDYIQLPHPEHFTGSARYYATRLHETMHWTGHPSLLNRRFGDRFDDSTYAFEELVAELGSAFLSADLGLPTELHHAAYIGSWVKLLRDYNRAILSAASHASLAAEYLKCAARVTDTPAVAA
jgi:antirestriction protein ArdC